jgi:transcriptional regulator with XRE-family HTH domain
MDRIDATLRALMAERQMSEVELAYLSGVSPSTVNLYVNGRRGRLVNKQSRRVYIKLAAALGVERTYFMEYRAWLVGRMLSWGTRHHASVDPAAVWFSLKLQAQEAAAIRLVNDDMRKSPHSNSQSQRRGR